MRKFTLVILATLGVTFAGTCTAAAAVSPAQVLAYASQYNGNEVAVTGTVEDLREKVSHRGNAYETFSLCGNTACLHVFAWGDDPRFDGEQGTLTGRFWTVKHVGRYTFYDELDVDSGG